MDAGSDENVSPFRWKVRCVDAQRQSVESYLAAVASSYQRLESTTTGLSLL